MASYPDASLQNVIENWWGEKKAGPPERGQLIWAFLPHVHQQQMILVPKGRSEPTAHQHADFEIIPLQSKSPPQAARLPVAGLPHYQGEVSAVYRAKRRPALVVSTGGDEVPRSLRTGEARHQTAATMLVAPYYGVAGGKTAAWRPEFVERIRRCEYPQYMWEKLPFPGKQESVLRLDQIQPLGRHGSAFEATGFRLTGEALRLLDEWLDWLLKGEGELSPETGLSSIREILLSHDA